MRIVACCGGMVIVSGMERMTFEVLRVLKESNAEVHCILNDWENHRIRELVESIGAGWSTGYYKYSVDRHTRNPLRLLAQTWCVFRTSAGLVRDASRFQATHILLPEFVSVVQNAPALVLLRAAGVDVVLRLANAPERGRFYDFIWRWIVPRLVTRVVPNSEFSMQRCLEVRVPKRKLVLIPNCVAARSDATGADLDVVALAKTGKTLLVVGQIAPFKGTHIAVEAALSLLERGVDIQLMIVGDALGWPPERVEYYRSMRERVESTPYAPRIHFVGGRTNVLAIMSASFLLLAPILQEETFGNVVLEAKSVGLPVVAFTRGAIPELVGHHKTGYLCRGLERDGLIEGIRYFLDMPEAWERARKASLESFRDLGCPYTTDAFTRAWRRIFSLNGGKA
jgi:glycosyltransferase involved in cell wall biosynthesis